MIQIVVGFTVYSRSDNQRIDNVYAFDMNPSKLKNEELPRMNKVTIRIAVYQWVELALIIAGIVLIILYKNNQQKYFLVGFGTALIIQNALMLGVDYSSGKRSIIYRQQLQTLIKK